MGYPSSLRRARGDGEKPISPHHHRSLHQTADSDQPTPVFGDVDDEEDEDGEGYNPLHTEAAKPGRKRHKISTIPPYVRERLTETKEHCLGKVHVLNDIIVDENGEQMLDALGLVTGEYRCGSPV